MERGRVMAVSEEVAAGLDVAQELYRKRHAKLCLAYLETVISPSLTHWYAACALLCQGIVLETPVCDCVAHGQEQCYQVGVYDAEGHTSVDPMYPLSTEAITVFARGNWDGFVQLLARTRQQGRGDALMAVLFARLCQLVETNEERH
jgi:hypothetical protein